MEITPEIQAEIDKQVAVVIDVKIADALKDIKEKLDNAYTARDTAVRKATDAEKALAETKREKDLDLLKAREEGRTTGEGKAADLAKRIEQLEQRNVELSRDKALSAALSTFQFRTATAADMARSMFLSSVQQNEAGEWVSKDGKPVADLVKSTLESEEHSFLLKPKSSSGAGTHSGKPPSDAPKALLDSSNEDILKRYN